MRSCAVFRLFVVTVKFASISPNCQPHARRKCCRPAWRREHANSSTKVFRRIIGHLFLNQYSSRNHTQSHRRNFCYVSCRRRHDQKKNQGPPSFMFVQMRMHGESRTCDCVTGIRCVRANIVHSPETTAAVVRSH